jgi:hypothetical protein
MKTLSLNIVMLVVSMIYTSNAQEWIQVNNGLTGDTVQCMVMTNASILVGTPTGLFRSSDNGDHWTKVFGTASPDNVSKIATNGTSVMIQANGSNWYVCSNEGIGPWSSVNVSTLPYSDYYHTKRVTPRCFAVMGSAIVVGTGYYGAMGSNAMILRTTDLGSTWTMVKEWYKEYYPVATLSTSSETYMGVHYDGSIVNNIRILKTTDDGLTWGSSQLPQSASYASSFVTAAFDYSDLFVSSTDYFGRYIHRTSDGGATWVSVSSGFPTNHEHGGADPPPFNPIAARSGKIFACVSDTLYSSMDNGLTWFPDLSAPTGKRALVLNDYVMFAGTNGGGVYRRSMSTSGSFTITLFDAENWGKPGTNARVVLYNGSSVQVAQAQANSSSVVTFTSIPGGSGYSYRVYVNRTTPWGEQFWGEKTGITVPANSTLVETFTRNAPYSPALNVYNDATGEDVYGKIVQPGTRLRIQHTITNPSYAGAHTVSAYGGMFIDRDKTPPYDFNSQTPSADFTVGTMKNLLCYFTPSASGDYYHSGSAFGSSSSYATSLTDAGNWGSAPFFTVAADGTPPPAPTSLASAPGGWTNTNSFGIDWTNPSDPSGIVAAWYKVGSVPVSATDGTRSTNKPMTVTATAEGGQDVYVWLEDGAGNKDHAARAVTVLYYDGTTPVNGTIAVNNGAASTSSLVVTLNSLGATDGGGSGLAQMRFSNNNSSWSDWEGVASTKAGWNLSLYGGASTAGTKTVYVQYRDNASNVSGSFSDEISYTGADVAAPGVPVSMTATPASWTNANPFSIDWVNPSDPSGIAAAWYKRGTPPTTSTDGTRTTQKPLVVAATAQGGQQLHLWLEDGSGNKDYANKATVQLFFDETPPSDGTISINNGATSTSSPIVSLGSLGANDAGGSGVFQVRFSNDTFAWSSWEGYSATRSGWDLTADGGGTAGGEKTVYVQYRDAAGNVSVTSSDKIAYVTTSVELWNAGVPAHFSLYQNFPNPFNPTTVIRFGLPVTSEVSLIVANMLGQEVAVLASGQMGPGSYGVQFDAGNLTSGIYLYRLRAGNFVETRRLVLLR